MGCVPVVPGPTRHQGDGCGGSIAFSSTLFLSGTPSDPDPHPPHLEAKPRGGGEGPGETPPFPPSHRDLSPTSSRSRGTHRCLPALSPLRPIPTGEGGGKGTPSLVLTAFLRVKSGRWRRIPTPHSTRFLRDTARASGSKHEGASHRAMGGDGRGHFHGKEGRE